MCYGHVGGVNQLVHLLQPVPDVPTIHCFGCNNESIFVAALEVGLAFVAEIGIVPEELPESVLGRLITFFGSEHANSPSSVQNQNLAVTLSNVPVLFNGMPLDDLHRLVVVEAAYDLP